jgi:ABC-type Mn2+/Zn2+ transport system ATPase subunit
VVSGVDLTVSAGDFWVLLGPNGRGKTSLVKAILGLLAPLAGTLDLAVDRQHLGFVPQRGELSDTLPMTVREFVDLGMVNLPLTRAGRRERLAAALREVGLDDRPAAPMRILSGGQHQRALIARALVRQPALLILDEPTTGLDVAAEASLMRCVAQLHRDRGLTVLLVTHDLDLARRHATHAGIFVDGTVRCLPMADPAAAAAIGRSFGLAEPPGCLP